jgi:ATP-dependent HslUV protease ATP-binding subunit HslU
VTLKFSDDAISAIADLAEEINQGVENIGARRLHTVLEKLLEDISFDASEKGGETFSITAEDVHHQVGELAKDADLRKFIL